MQSGQIGIEKLPGLKHRTWELFVGELHRYESGLHFPLPGHQAILIPPRRVIGRLG